MEKWKEIKGYEGLYQVSNEGRVRSVERFVEYLVKGKYPAKRLFPSTILKTHINNNGYELVDLHYKGEKDKRSVHRLVAETFIPNLEKKPTVNHKNHVRTDNRVENLEWATYPEQFDEIWKDNNIGKVYSEESKKKMSISQKKRFENEESLMKGKHHKEDTKEKISDKNSKTIYQYTIDNKLVGVFKNSILASQETGFPQASINKYAHGKYFSKQRNKWYYGNTYKGYKWSFEPL